MCHFGGSQARITWVPVWAFQELACFVGAAPDVGPELDEIQAWEPVWIQAWEPVWIQALAGFPAWPAELGGSRDVAAVQGESRVSLLDVAEALAVLVPAWPLAVLQVWLQALLQAGLQVLPLAGFQASLQAGVG
jgi:hypothetical protein